MRIIQQLYLVADKPVNLPIELSLKVTELREVVVTHASKLENKLCAVCKGIYRYR